MLTVIAIIGVLAAILLPTLRMIQGKARVATAKSDISAIGQALTVYSQDFGALPPDSNARLLFGSGPEPFGDMDMPNECLVWFLTREYVKGSGAGAGGSDSGWIVGPKDSLKINSRITATSSPYFEIRAKARRDFDNDKFYEFLDPWGRPYMYRAYPDAWRSITDPPSVDGNLLTLILNVPPNLEKLEGAVGKIRFKGFDPDALNNTFAFEGEYDEVNKVNKVKIEFSDTPPAITILGEYQFVLHNRKTCDIYSLGPNGRTRSAANPKDTNGNTTEWKPQNGSTKCLDCGKIGNFTECPNDPGHAVRKFWTEVWGSPGDGNDVAKDGNLGIMDEKHKDDINNWQ